MSTDWLLYHICWLLKKKTYRGGILIKTGPKRRIFISLFSSNNDKISFSMLEYRRYLPSTILTRSRFKRTVMNQTWLSFLKWKVTSNFNESPRTTNFFSQYYHNCAHLNWRIKIIETKRQYKNKVGFTDNQFPNVVFSFLGPNLKVGNLQSVLLLPN